MFKAAQISEWIEAQQANPKSLEALALFSSLEITGINTLKEAGPNDLAFFFSKHYEKDLRQTRAGLVIIGSAFTQAIEASGLPAWKHSVFIECAEPYLAMAKVTQKFSRELSSHDHQKLNLEMSIHKSAVIDPTAQIGKGVQIGAHSVIEAGSILEDQVVIYPNCYVGPKCEIGAGSVLFPKVTLYEKTKVGKLCRIHAGAVLGADGFGYAPVFDSNKLPIKQQKIYHLGRVVLEDEVEIGANTTIDRGTLGDTLIRKGAKLDNLVQIGHNSEIGEGSILCSGSGMAGSATLGKFVYLGAQSGPGNQVHVGDYAKFATFTGAIKDIEPFATVAGVPARPLSNQLKIIALQNKLLREREKK